MQSDTIPSTSAAWPETWATPRSCEICCASVISPYSLTTDRGRVGETKLIYMIGKSPGFTLRKLGGVVETAALMAFLPSLCKHLLDEELAMPSVATWWCGHEDARRYVEEHLESLVIKPAFPIFGPIASMPAWSVVDHTDVCLFRIGRPKAS